jgi:hypothetical protein
MQFQIAAHPTVGAGGGDDAVGCDHTGLRFTFLNIAKSNTLPIINIDKICRNNGN